MESSGRKKWLLKAALAVTVLSAVILLLFHFDEPLRRHFGGVKTGVSFRGVDVTGLFRPEVAEIVQGIAQAEGRKPVDAALVESGESIIPELNGMEIDCEKTIERVMSASRATAVDPVYRQIFPALRWDHYPARPAYQGNPRKPMVAFMINVAWGDEFLEPMLTVLEGEGAGGTFFLTGLWAEKNEPLCRRIMEGGHELGNHGYSDGTVFPEMDGWDISHSIRQTNEVIFEAAGCYPAYFTPHKGEFNDLTLEIVSRQGMRTVLWTLDTVDWQKPGVAAMQEKILKNIGPGQIILMHPTEETVALLKLIIPLIKERGLSIVTMRELFDPAWPGTFPAGVEP